MTWGHGACVTTTVVVWGKLKCFTSNSHFVYNSKMKITNDVTNIESVCIYIVSLAVAFK